MKIKLYRLKNVIMFYSSSLYVCAREKERAYIKSRSGEKDVCGLSDISSMEAVVVCYVAMVMVLQGHHVSDKGVDWDAEGFQ